MNLSPDVSPATTDKIDSSPDSDLSVSAPQPNPSDFAAVDEYVAGLEDASGIADELARRYGGLRCDGCGRFTSALNAVWCNPVSGGIDREVCDDCFGATR